MPLTPIQIAQRMMMGSGLVVAGYCASYLPFASPFQHHTLLQMLWIGHWEILFSAVPFVAGWLVIWQNYRLIDRGLINGIWNDSQLDAARTYLALPIFGRVIVLSMVGCIGLIVVNAVNGWHHAYMAYILIWAVNPIAYMKGKLRIPGEPVAPTGWRSSAPIHSDQWGQPPSAA